MTGSGVTSSGEPFQWFSFQAGGLGARHNHDGDNGEWHVMANCKNESVEIWEHRYPLRFEEFSLIDDSGGPGCYRGGLGLRRRMRLLARTLVNSTADRQEVGPWPIDGGERGRPNRYSMITNEGQTLSLKDRFGLSSNSKFANLPFEEGEQLIIDSAGGGGYGSAAKRDPALVARDREYEYISAPSA